MLFLRFLATGESYESLQYQLRIHRTTIGRFVPLICKAIYNCLKEKYLKMLRTKDKWKSVADKTLDCGSEYYKYKGFFISNVCSS